MKRILIILLGILLVVGCSKETPNPIVGTWALYDYGVTNARTGKALTASTDVKTWTFNESGSAYINGSIPLTYVIKDNILVLTYVRSGKEQSYKIVELNDHYLEVEWTTIPGKYQDPSEWWYCFSKME